MKRSLSFRSRLGALALLCLCLGGCWPRLVVWESNLGSSPLDKVIQRMGMGSEQGVAEGIYQAARERGVQAFLAESNLACRPTCVVERHLVISTTPYPAKPERAIDWRIEIKVDDRIDGGLVVQAHRQDRVLP
jgi:hypothetical protein